MIIAILAWICLCTDIVRNLISVAYVKIFDELFINHMYTYRTES